LVIIIYSRLAMYVLS